RSQRADRPGDGSGPRAGPYPRARAQRRGRDGGAPGARRDASGSGNQRGDPDADRGRLGRTYPLAQAGAYPRGEAVTLVTTALTIRCRWVATFEGDGLASA